MEAFFSQVRGKMRGEATAKGYAGENGDGRDLIDFVAKKCGEGHATGEIVYKVIRWAEKRDPADLFKIAAWAFLEWDRCVARAVQDSAVSKKNGQAVGLDTRGQVYVHDLPSIPGR